MPVAHLAFRGLSYFYSHQSRASAAHLSRPIVFAHRRLCRAASKVHLAGVHWQAHSAIAVVALLAGTTVLIWSQGRAISMRVADVLRTWIEGLRGDDKIRGGYHTREGGRKLNCEGTASRSSSKPHRQPCHFKRSNKHFVLPYPSTPTYQTDFRTAIRDYSYKYCAAMLLYHGLCGFK